MGRTCRGLRGCARARRGRLGEFGEAHSPSSGGFFVGPVIGDTSESGTAYPWWKPDSLTTCSVRRIECPDTTERFTNLASVGVGNSSDWLVRGAVLAPAEHDLHLSRTADQLRTLLNKPPPKPLDWRYLKTHHRKLAATRLLARTPFVFSIVATWKPGIFSTFLQQSPNLYKYAARFLIERLTWYADDRGRRLNLFFDANRSATSYTDLAAYMARIQNDPHCQIRPGCLDAIKPVSPTLKMAQIADFYVSATA